MKLSSAALEAHSQHTQGVLTDPDAIVMSSWGLGALECWCLIELHP